MVQGTFIFKMINLLNLSIKYAKEKMWIVQTNIVSLGAVNSVLGYLYPTQQREPNTKTDCKGAWTSRPKNAITCTTSSMIKKSPMVSGLVSDGAIFSAGLPVSKLKIIKNNFAFFQYFLFCRIKGWWVLHHYFSILLSGFLLIW